MPKAKKTILLRAAWLWQRTRDAMRKKLEEGFAGAEASAARLNYNVLNDVDPDRRLELDAGMRALQKKITEGRYFAREMAEALNYNVTHDVETERRLEPEREPIEVRITIIEMD